MKKRSLFLRILLGILAAAVALGSLAACAILLHPVLFGTGFTQRSADASVADAQIMDRYDMAITNRISASLDGILAIEKVYWLTDEDVVAPKADPECFGTSEDAASLQWLLDAAQPLLAGQSTLFHTDVELLPNSKVYYYLDETLLVIIWQEHHDGSIYTYTEVKLAHPSQFRRFLAGNEYGHDKQYLTTKLSADVNAVMASSADFYGFRQEGIVVYNGKVERADTRGKLDTCFIDAHGDLIFSPAGELTEPEQTQQYVDAHDIRFSVSFGPILINNGVNCVPKRYHDGEINGAFPRAALCQADELHYYIIVANSRGRYQELPNMKAFTKYVEATGCPMAYALDGGQTATIAMDHQHINPVQYGSQRKVSDIIYFATAIPEGG